MKINLKSTLLIIEDSPSELELMSHYLADTGFNIMKATSAKEGLQVALVQKPDVIITDVVMPEMSGFELCRLLRRNPVTKNLAIVICSSKNSEIDQLWGIRQGADVYITKPYTREELLQAIKYLRSSNRNQYLSVKDSRGARNRVSHFPLSE